MSSRETTPSVRDYATAGKGRKRHCHNDNNTPSTSDRRFLAINLPSATSSDRSTPFQGTVSAWIEETTQAIFEGKRILKMPGDVADRVVKKGIAMFEEKEEEVARKEGREYRPGKWREVVPIEVLERYEHLFVELFGRVVKVEEGEEGLDGRESKKRKLGGDGGRDDDDDEEEDEDDMQVEDIPSTPEFITIDDDDDEEEDDTDDRRDKEFWPTTTTTTTTATTTMGVPPRLPPPGSGMKRLGALTMRPSPINVSRWRCSPLRNSCYSSVEGTPTLVDDDTDNDNTSSSSSSSSLDDHTLTPEEGAGESGAVLTKLQVGTAIEAESVPVSPQVELVALMQSDTEDEGVGGGGVRCVGKGDVGTGTGLGIGREREKDGVVVNRNANRSSSSSSSTSMTLKGLGLSLKPNPLMLSKRTWAPRAAIIVDDVRDEVTPGGGGVGGVGDALLGTVSSIPRKRVVAPMEGGRRSTDGVYYPHQYRGHRRSSKSRRMIDEMEELSGEEVCTY